MEKYDIVIIGAATSGAYFARKMAKKGYSVKVIEKLSPEKLGTRMDIFHVSQTDLKTYEMPTVKQGDPEWAFEFTDNHFSSPSNKYQVYTTAKTVGLHMHEYVALMVKLAGEAGAEIEYSAEFREFVFTEGAISGVRYETAEGMKELAAKVVVDCSGSGAAARRALPNGYGVENFRLMPEDMFYVILRYAKFAGVQINNFWLNTKSWTAPFSMDNTEKIIGTGAVRSFENAEKDAAKLDAAAGLGEFEEVRVEKGTTPYRRPPYSLVADNFIVTGDAACLTKPDCGEGVTSSMVMMDIAADTLDTALRRGDTSKKALWSINREYNRAQGADFSLVRAFLTSVVNCVSDDEIEYCFAEGILNGKFLNGEKICAKDIVEAVTGVISGISHKNISGKTIAGVIKGASLGLALRQHYIGFPDDPSGFESWCRRSDRLWKKVGRIN